MQPRAIILRAPQRAAATVAALTAAGISSSCCQLIETVWPEDLTGLDTHVARLREGRYDWTVFTSVTTVHAVAERLGTGAWPQGTRIAAVGTKTAEQAHAAFGRQAHFVPQLQSAAGMVAEWQLAPRSRVFYPHGDLASPTLAEGLGRRGMRLDEVLAYRTVAAGSGGEPVARSVLPPGIRVLDPGLLAGELPETDLLVFAAPSIVRRFVQLAGTGLPARTRTLAIGQPTARALAAAGLPVHDTAADPTPAGLAASARKILKTIHPNR
ncbi:uroporphyrinogen-III synthase [Glutamicibacter sp. MNS18]|uniref:uroporphyrinogen-III synthase n=1 Tax=Glutamicibacter sp. MNS18 TaxID=2989817 RepID=UPI002235BA08|nr:uroporphyrinogen-III synthase [Glutamicibacter sp. MNS18]MCW4464353.1 uroporphyrinogen-III synthase [Glutamicibacter sp. MNS18]